MNKNIFSFRESFYSTSFILLCEIQTRALKRKITKQWLRIMFHLWKCVSKANRDGSEQNFHCVILKSVDEVFTDLFHSEYNKKGSSAFPMEEERTLENAVRRFGSQNILRGYQTWIFFCLSAWHHLRMDFNDESNFSRLKFQEISNYSWN